MTGLYDIQHSLFNKYADTTGLLPMLPLAGSSWDAATFSAIPEGFNICSKNATGIQKHRKRSLDEIGMVFTVPASFGMKNQYQYRVKFDVKREEEE